MTSEDVVVVIDEDLEKFRVFILDEKTGKFSPLNFLGVTEVETTSPSVVNYLLRGRIFRSKDIVFQARTKINKTDRVPNRKRYIKLMMSHGVSRNDANDRARLVRLCGGCYQESYSSLRLFGGFDPYKDRRVSNECE